MYHIHIYIPPNHVVVCDLLNQKVFHKENDHSVSVLLLTANFYTIHTINLLYTNYNMYWNTLSKTRLSVSFEYWLIEIETTHRNPSMPSRSHHLTILHMFHDQLKSRGFKTLFLYPGLSNPMVFIGHQWLYIITSMYKT